MCPDCLPPPPLHTHTHTHVLDNYTWESESTPTTYYYTGLYNGGANNSGGGEQRKKKGEPNIFLFKIKGKSVVCASSSFLPPSPSSLSLSYQRNYIYSPSIFTYFSSHFCQRQNDPTVLLIFFSRISLFSSISPVLYLMRSLFLSGDGQK